MKHLKQAGLVMALVLVACVGATSASATTIEPTGTAVTLTSTYSNLVIHGAPTLSCTGSTITGTTPTISAASLTIPINLNYTGCSAFSSLVVTTITVPAVCTAAGASAVKLNVTGETATTATADVFIPAGCTITLETPAIFCTTTISGPQTTGQFNIMNGNASTRTSGTLSGALLDAIVDNTAGTFGCPTAGAHTGTLNGTYNVTTPAANPGITVTP
jgi:hypothetical protein